MAEELVWCDAHLDLAHLALAGRDLTLPPKQATGGPTPAAFTFPSLADGGVRWAFATIFTGPDYGGPGGYPRGDVEAAHTAGVAQLDLYRRWEEEGHLRIVHGVSDLDAEAPLRVILLMEGCDPIRSSDEVEWWYERALRAAGLTWQAGTRLAGGNLFPGPLTAAGAEMARAFDEAGVIHDLSHLCDEAAGALLDIVEGRLIASHSNVRSLLQGLDLESLPEGLLDRYDADTLLRGARERHLSDELLKELSRRHAVVGLNLFSRFLIPQARRATIDETIAHVRQMTQLMGRHDGVGLGSDLDGGFGADQLPEGINSPPDYARLTAALSHQGWSSQEISGFTHHNWLRLLRESLPS